MSNKIQNKKIAIIGAGLAGITLARELSNSNDSNEVVIFDKSRGIGGRMATRRVEDYHFDHGAQFFTARSAEFKDLCKIAKNDNAIEEWTRRFAEIVGTNIKVRAKASNIPYFVGTPQMNSFCKYLAKDLNILLEKQVESVDFDGKKWSLNTADNEIFNDFDYLFLAIPSHQAINFIPKSCKYFDIVANTKMSACFSLMLGFKKGLELDFDSALVKDSIISWISVNNSKPGRPRAFSLLINSSNKWADENLDEDPELLKSKMLNALGEIINLDVNNIDYQNIHRWKYANAPSRKFAKSLFDQNLNLGVCGDWLVSGRVESAFLSGLNLHNNINKNFK